MARGQLDLFSMLVGGFVGHRIGKNKGGAQELGRGIPGGAIYLFLVLLIGIAFVVILVAEWVFGYIGLQVALWGILGTYFMAFVKYQIIEPWKERKQPPQGSPGFTYTYVPEKKDESA